MNNIQLMDAMTDLEDSYLTHAWNRMDSSSEERPVHVSAWRRVWIAAVAALVLSSFAVTAALGADFRDFGKALVQPVSLLKMIYIVGFLNGFRARTFVYLLLASFGAGMRLMVSERRDFWILGLSAPAIYALCELMIQHNQDYYLGLPFPVGVFALCFTVGYWLCTLVLLVHRIIRRNRPERERKAVIAVIALLLLSSFTMAMAVNADFRETVFSVFHIGQTETVPDGQEPVDEGTLNPISDEDIDNAVKTYYFRGNGVIMLTDGMIYSAQYDRDAAAFYDFDENGLKALNTQHADFRYTFRGTEFHIAYDYTVFNGELFLRPKVDPIVNENPYKYDWDLPSPGIDAHTAWLLLPYLDQEDYCLYPLQINVQTQEITDVFENTSFEGIQPNVWKFSDDSSFAILTGRTTDGQDACWLCDVRKGTITPLSNLVGRLVQSAYFLEKGTVICYALNDDGFDVIRFDPVSGELSAVAKKMHRAASSADGSGYLEIQYHGAPGKHALLCNPDGTCSLLDLRNGALVPLDGLPSGNSFLTFESPDGKYVLFAWKNSKNSKTNTLQRIGVLNTEAGVIKLLDRENRQTREEHLASWLANNCFTIFAYDETDTDGWYLYVYDFR